LLFHLLDNLSCIEIMVVMLQKEVADRICAGPGSKEYGRLSVNVQAVCEAESLFTVGRGAFTPSPNVDSSVIRLQPAGGMSSRVRRKTLLLFGKDGNELSRAETLDERPAEAGRASETEPPASPAPVGRPAHRWSATHMCMELERLDEEIRRLEQVVAETDSPLQEMYLRLTRRTRTTTERALQERLARA
jgi:hypothetical protein